MGLAAARQRAVKAMLFASFLAGIVLSAPVIARGLAARDLGKAVLYITAYLVAALAFAVHGFAPAFQYGASVSMLILLGASQFAFFASPVEGVIWLMAAPPLATFLLGTLAGSIYFVLGLAITLSAVWASTHGHAGWAIPQGWTEICLSAGISDLLCIICASIGGTNSLAMEKEQTLLKKERAERQASISRLELNLAGAQNELASARHLASRRETMFRAVVEHGTDVLMILEPDARIRMASESVHTVLHYDASELEGRDLFSLCSPEDTKNARAIFNSAMVSDLPAFSTSMEMIKKTGQTVQVQIFVSNYLHNADIAGLMLSIRDLTFQKKAEAKAAFYEQHDQLTGLPNRETLVRELERAVTIARNRNRVFGVMALGLDHFRRINDMHGTEAGDQVLKAVSEALKLQFRNDDIIARYRGDMFYILFPEISSQEHIKDIIAKAKTAFEKPYAIPPGEHVLLTASMGVALFPNDGRESSELMRNADTALYMAKESGRDCYRLFDAALNSLLVERQRIENDLSTSIEQSRFEPWFQPKVDANGCIVGAEALVRWRHPSGQIKAPGYFIEIAEKNGSIDRIGDIMLRATCRAASDWHRRGLLQVPISVNLSPRQFGKETLIEDIRSILLEENMDPRLVEFEITESGMMENEQEGIRKLNQLKDLGSSVSIDDFGTGYSSFSKLKDFPIDTLKLDKSFVDPLPGERNASIIASAIVDLAHTLKFDVVAEGVETQDQLQFLSAIFCDTFQGYLFSKPVPAHEFEAMLASGKPLAHTC